MLLANIPRRALVLLVFLMVLVSASEGIGIFLLVPLLATIEGSQRTFAVARFTAHFGVDLRLGPLLAAFVALVFLRAILHYRRVIQAKRLSIQLADNFRLRCFRLLLSAEWRALSEMRQSDNASLIIASIDRLTSAFHFLVSTLTAAVTLGALGLSALLLSPRLALIAGAGGLIALYAYRGLRRRAVHLGSILGDAHESLFAQMSDSLGALRLIKSFGAESRASKAMEGAVRDLRQTEIAYVRSSGRGQIVLQTAGAAVLALSSWVAIEHFVIPPPVLLPIVAIFVRAVPLLGSLQENWQNWLHCTPAIVDISEMIAKLERKAEPPQLPSATPPSLRNAIDLVNVSILHHGRQQPAINQLTLSVPALTITALVGPSGSGKSTLADIVSGLIRPDSGEIRIDNILLDGPVRRAWRETVAYVHQEPILFHDTIRENLLWARPNADEAAMRRALVDASAEFVLSLPSGLDAIVGDRGCRLSGGERQRISLARALLREPALLILDEPTSSLDQVSERAILDALERLRGRLTMLVIAHRGALTELADRTITLDRGTVVSIAQHNRNLT